MRGRAGQVPARLPGRVPLWLQEPLLPRPTPLALLSLCLPHPGQLISYIPSVNVASLMDSAAGRGGGGGASGLARTSSRSSDAETSSDV